MNFDLFSERNSEGTHQYSSPIQETEKIQELRLERENKTLLDTRNVLIKGIEELERQWNELQSLEAEDEMEEEQSDGEDELIFDLLVEKSKKNKRSEDDMDEADEEEHDDHDKVPFDESKYTAKPLKDWPTRIEYLKKFYSYLEIHNAKSRLALETDSRKKSLLIKTISFEITYANVFVFDVGVRLYSKDNTYHIWKLDILKKSNNKFNTILLKMSDHFSHTKNINEFLFSLNTLYELLISRQKTLDELNEEYDNKEPHTSTIHANTFRHREISLIWDVVFQNGVLYPLVTVNSAYNAVFADMVDLYGVRRAVQTLIDGVYGETEA